MRIKGRAKFAAFQVNCGIINLVEGITTRSHNSGVWGWFKSEPVAWYICLSYQPIAR